MNAILPDPDRANLAALFLHGVISHSTATPPKGTVKIIAGGMVARVVFGTKTLVESGEGPADCTVRGSLGILLKVGVHGGSVSAWLTGKVRVRGNLFKALAFLKVVQCRS